MRVVFTVVALAACGGSDARPDAPPVVDGFDEQSGTRLARRGWNADGTKLFGPIVDTARDEICDVMRWTDGKTYCTPFERRGTVVYADAACTQPLGLASKTSCSGPVRYLLQLDDSACGVVAAHLYEAGPALPATSYFVRGAAGCFARELPETYEELRALGPEVPASAFATLVLTEPRGEHRLQQRFYESDDGLRYAWSLHDRELDEDCTLYDDTCFPQNTLDASRYGDAACTRRVALSYSTCDTPRFASYPEQPQCPRSAHALARLGAPGPGTVYEQAGATCEAIDTGGASTFELGAPLAMATVELAYAGPSARIQHAYATSEGDRFPVRMLYDAQLQTICAAGLAEDGVMRCLPRYARIDRYFRDAACTQTIDVTRVFTGPAGCAPVTPPRFAGELAGSDGCNLTQSVRVVGAQYTGPLFDEACQPISSPSAAFYEVGATVAPADFVMVAPTTE